VFCCRGITVNVNASDDSTTKKKKNLIRKTVWFLYYLPYQKLNLNLYMYCRGITVWFHLLIKNLPRSYSVIKGVKGQETIMVMIVQMPLIRHHLTYWFVHIS